MTANPRYFACILAGGSGERFWPLSRTSTPKHLLRLFSEETLLGEAVKRLEGVVLRENIFVLTNTAQAAGVRAALPGLDPAQIVCEPAKRDTAPAAALATGLVRARRPDAILGLLPSDALIRNSGRFAAQLSDALGWAESGPAGQLLTFSIPPSYPATGFGYLELGELLGVGALGSRILAVRRFVEKPDAAAASQYVSSGRFGWNAGMFVWSADAFLGEADLQAPQLAAFVRGFSPGDPTAYLSKHFGSLPKISLDYALMEKASSVATVVAEFDWDDVGTWTALPKHFPSDATGNTVRGSIVSVGSADNIAVSSGRTIALCGVKDLVVVETPDAVLVCHRDSVQDIKKLQPLLPPDLL